MTQLAGTGGGHGGGHGGGFEVLTEELRATKREIHKALDSHEAAGLADDGLGSDAGHRELTLELSDFLRELDKREQEFRELAEGTGDSLDFAAFCYDNTDHWIAKMWLRANGQAV